MEIAAADGSLSMFERHRRYLENAHLPPLLKTQYLIHAGEGFARLGDPEAARDHLTEGMSLAAQYGYNHLLFYAETQLDNVPATASAVESETPMPEALAPIADAIRHRHAGVIALR